MHSKILLIIAVVATSISGALLGAPDAYAIDGAPICSDSPPQISQTAIDKINTDTSAQRGAKVFNPLAVNTSDKYLYGKLLSDNTRYIFSSQYLSTTQNQSNGSIGNGTGWYFKLVLNEDGTWKQSQYNNNANVIMTGPGYCVYWQRNYTFPVGYNPVYPVYTGIVPCQYNAAIGEDDPECVPPTKPFTTAHKLQFGDKMLELDNSVKDVTNSWISLFDTSKNTWSGLSSGLKDQLTERKLEIQAKASSGSGVAVVQVIDGSLGAGMAPNNEQCVQVYQPDIGNPYMGSEPPCQYAIMVVTWDDSINPVTVNANGVVFTNACYTIIYKHHYNGSNGLENNQASSCTSSLAVSENIGYVMGNNIKYATGYGSYVPPNTIIAQAENPNYAPDWYISKIEDYKANIHDKNFNTFDGNPFLCEQGLAPVLHYELWEKNNSGDTLIKSGIQSATVQIDVDFGSSNVKKDYEILGWYNCGATDPLQFTEQGRVNFSVGADGGMGITLWENCVSPDFPFINFNDCVQGFENVANIMFTGKVEVPNIQGNYGCSSIPTLGGWLNLPSGYQICPMIPSDIRAITTPFIAFALGLLTIGFIRRTRV